MSDKLADNAHAEIAVVCALALELAPLLARCDRARKTTAEGFVVHGAWLHAKRVALVEAGNRSRDVRRATIGLIDAHSPDLVIAAGLAGALSGDLRFGHVLVANEITSLDGGTLAVDGAAELVASAPAQWSSRLHVGRLLTVDQIVRTAEEKRKLHHQHRALAVDMESLIVARVCCERQTRFLAVRVVSDEADADLPPEVLSLFGASKFLRLGAALGAVWHRPAAAKELWQLRDRANQAAERLAEFLEEQIARLQ